MDRVLFPLLSSRVVVIAVVTIRHLNVRFLDVAEQFLVDYVFKRLPRLHDSVRVCVFRSKISSAGASAILTAIRCQPIEPSASGFCLELIFSHRAAAWTEVGCCASKGPLTL